VPSSSNGTMPSSSNGTVPSSNSSNTANSSLTVFPYSVYSIFTVINDLPLVKDVFFSSLNLTKNVISVPSMRKLSPIFFFFSNFDDLYLYMFHDRLYG
jgi:hypothetical protein